MNQLFAMVLLYQIYGNISITVSFVKHEYSSSSPDCHIWWFRSPLLTIMSLSEILPGKTEEMNLNLQPGAIPTNFYCSVAFVVRIYQFV